MSEIAATFRAVPQTPSAEDALFTVRECRYGTMKWLTRDYGVGKMLEQFGEYFEGEVAVFRKLLRPGDVVVSAGGNIGVHLVPLSQIVGKAGTVLTFEPQEFVRERLLKPNLEMNGCDNVFVRGEALGSDVGSAFLPQIDYTVPNNFGGMELRAAGPIEVPVVPLDQLELPRLDFLMLDVEGFEENALRGARETIMRCRPYLYVEIDREETREQVLRLIRHELKYELTFHTPTAYEDDNFAGNAVNPYGQMCSVMCLGIPR